MICRTEAECRQAGWDDGAEDRPLSQQEIERLTVLHSPYLVPDLEAS